MAHELGHEGFGAASAAGMDSNYGQGMGGLEILNTLAGGAKAGQQAMDYANQLYPQVAEADPWEAALRFFLKMGQDSSVPGATAVGAAFGAAPAALDYLTAKKKEKSETDRARMTAAVQLAPNLKPKEKTATQLNYKSVIITRPDGTSYEDYIPTSQIANLQAKGFKVLAKSTSSTATGNTTVGVDPNNLLALRTLLAMPNLTPDANNNVIIPNTSVSSAVSQGLISPKKSAPSQGVEKYLQQDRVMYMAEADAIEKLKLFNVTPDSPEYEDLLALMTTDDNNLIGRPVIQADSYLNFYVPRAGMESEFNVITRTPGGSPVPAEVMARNEEIKDLVPIVLKQRQVMNDLLPTLESAMTVLLQNPDATGAFQSYTMPIRNFLSSSFGFQDGELEDQRYLEAISNKLAPQMRPVGSGATSDMEFRAYKSAILSMDNPAKSNYLTLYSLDKTTRNAAEELALRKRLLTQNKSAEYIENKISELDKGIYQKFERPSPDMSLQDFLSARDVWKSSLPNGAVILNKDSSGKKIYPNAGTFIIKGWRGQ